MFAIVLFFFNLVVVMVQQPRSFYQLPNMNALFAQSHKKKSSGQLPGKKVPFAPTFIHLTHSLESYKSMFCICALTTGLLEKQRNFLETVIRFTYAVPIFFTSLEGIVAGLQSSMTTLLRALVKFFISLSKNNLYRGKREGRMQICIFCSS